MTNRVHWNSPHVRFFLALITAGVLGMATPGCGGGGGGGGSTTTGTTTNGTTNNGTTPGSTATVTGQLLDTTKAPVPNANITIIGPNNYSVTKATDSNGNFTFTNVPLTATSLSIANPNAQKYYSYAIYNNATYDTVNCMLPLPAVAKSSFSVGIIYLQAGGLNNPPPAPPLGGCPK